MEADPSKSIVSPEDWVFGEKLCSQKILNKKTVQNKIINRAGSGSVGALDEILDFQPQKMQISQNFTII